MLKPTDMTEIISGTLEGRVFLVKEITGSTTLDELKGADGLFKEVDDKTDMVDDKKNEEEPAAAKAEKPKKKQKASTGHPPKIELDMPAVKAMRDAGRSWEWIGEEMNCSGPTVKSRYREVFGDE